MQNRKPRTYSGKSRCKKNRKQKKEDNLDCVFSYRCRIFDYEIYNTFLGKTFYGKIEDDDGFTSDYKNNTLNQYKVYWLNTDEYSLTFNKDGTIYYTSMSDMTVLAYPKSISEPKGTHYEYDGTYNSFSIEVSLSGEIFIKIGGLKYWVGVNDNNVPQSILSYGLKEITYSDCGKDCTK